MDFLGFGNSLVIPVQVEVQRRVGPVQLSADAALAVGVSIMHDSSRPVELWRVGGLVERRFGSVPRGWFGLHAGYTVLEVEDPRTGVEVGAAGGVNVGASGHTSVGPYLGGAVAVVD